MAESNLFTMLSTYRPGSPASPFENYCTNGLAYFLNQGHRMLTALFAHVAGVSGEPLAMVEVQPQLADAGVADLVLTFEGGTRIIVEVQVEVGADEGNLPAFEAAGRAGTTHPAFVLLGLGSTAPAPWLPVTWLNVVEALEDDPDPMAQQFTEFILRDILGLGDVPLEQALTTNRLYALGGAAVRRRFGSAARYVNSASRPMAGGKYRYLGTTFAPAGSDMSYWIGIVNEAIPLSEHYHLMLASKETPVAELAEHPRATGDWKWSYWTGLGRVVRPITGEVYDDLLARLPG
jgi:hypothetical protein